MSDAIISVENLGKKYRISHQGERPRYTALRDVIAEKAKRLFRRTPTSDLRPLTSGARASHEDFWALKDVSFEVKQGEVVGIIGRNGAGKSTLLKILSRITEPTEGRVRIKGRVASLLEVGTGFHPELTGRENIFLNGAILGMTRVEIKKKFDEMVAFAEVEKFLDTPVKRYSSGMYVRLAFAVAAHLEPEILIVDEVLAVGDAEFQKKCLGKMQEVAKGKGRTVLFVSHNMAAVRHLCATGLYLVNGKLAFSGPVDKVVAEYLSTASKGQEKLRVSRGGLELADFRLCATDSPTPLSSVIFGKDYEIRFVVKGDSAGTRIGPVLRFYNDTGALISSVCGPEEGIDFLPIDGEREWVVRLSGIRLFPGDYTVSFQMFGTEPHAYLEADGVLTFSVEGALIDGASRAYRSDHGLFRICDGVKVGDTQQ